MKKFNRQIAPLIENQGLCQKVLESTNLGLSLRYVANKYGISRYSAKKVAEYMQINNTKPITNNDLR